METSAITKQMIGLQKTLFVNTHDGLTVLQDYSQNMMQSYMKLVPWISDENMKPFEDSMEYIKKVREDYKHTVGQGFVKLEQMACALKK